MTRLDKAEVIAQAKKMDVQFIRLQFTDILGLLKNVAIPLNQLESALDGELMFDGSSIEGFVRIEESDMLLKPDPDTFTIFPWRPRSGAVARLLCDIYTADDTPFIGCPRSVLKRALAVAKDMGYTLNIGAEVEFFLFLTDQQNRPTTYTHDSAGYFDLAPVDLGENARRDMVLALQEMGYEVEASHHEVAPGQHEIYLKSTDGLVAVDQLITMKYAVRSIAQRHGLHASFMPKPLTGKAGSGMHLHESLFKDGINAFYDPQNPGNLSETARYYLGGLMKHAAGFTAVTNPLVNSYKRLMSGFEAPIDVSWSARTRNPLVRVPSQRSGDTRLEVRSPDPSCNPYLAIAVMLMAGLEGIKEQIIPPEPTDYPTSPGQAEKLPMSLREALTRMADDDLVKQTLGPHIYQRFIEAKSIEWSRYQKQVHHWEIDEYLSKF